MYDFINGIFDSQIDDYIVIDVSGVGYKIFTSQNTMRSIKLGSKIKIFTHLAVKEDDLVLFGFSDRSELKLFRLLISVTGVGPKASLSLLSEFSLNQITKAILMKDISLLTKASGIGKKIAERIILELKDKIVVEDGPSNSPILETNDIKTEVIEALVSLGYNYNVASAAVSKIEKEDKSIDIMIKEALRLIAAY